MAHPYSGSEADVPGYTPRYAGIRAHIADSAQAEQGSVRITCRENSPEAHPHPVATSRARHTSAASRAQGRDAFTDEALGHRVHMVEVEDAPPRHPVLGPESTQTSDDLFRVYQGLWPAVRSTLQTPHRTAERDLMHPRRPAPFVPLVRAGEARSCQIDLTSIRSRFSPRRISTCVSDDCPGCTEGSPHAEAVLRRSR